MLFNSVAFVFYFLPVALATFYLSQKSADARLPLLVLIFWSLVFYGAWEPAGTLILLASIAFNYAAGHALVYRRVPDDKRTLLMAGAIAIDVLALGYYKYTGFVLANLNSFLGLDMAVPSIILPLAISFFTFTQIAFLVDAWRGEVKELDLIQYLVFVTFFPHLIAGPIYHHREMMPQFARIATAPIEWVNVAVGLTLFAMGLVKKVVFADSIAGYADPVFAAAAGAWSPTFLEAWGGLLAFTLQIYFDFSGYTDMALGLALMLNVRMPMNFNSPLKATGIIDLWRRWHMSLTRFLTDYVFSPLALLLARAGMERGAGRIAFFLLSVVVPLNITFLVSGVWHGAGWTYVLFGLINGLALTINYVWREQELRAVPGWLGWVLTMLAFLASLVFFRAESIDAALVLLQGLAGLNGLALPAASADGLFGAVGWLSYLGIRFDDAASAYLLPGQGLWIGALGAIVLLAPNTQQMLWRYRPVIDAETEFTPSPFEAMLKPQLDWLGAVVRRNLGAAGGFGARWGAAVAVLISLVVIGQSWVRVHVAQFIYFQF